MKPEKVQRHPWDWYVEEQWVTLALVEMIRPSREVTYLDPACGLCHVPMALESSGFTAFGTDLFQRTTHRSFMGEHNFLGDQAHILHALPALSIWFNPPYSFQDGILIKGLAERFIRRALGLATHQVAALLPVKWLATTGRYALFTEHTPTGIYILCDRPSMPPGDMLEQLGRDAWRGGKVDFMWVVWDHHAEPMRDASGRPFAPTYWIPPRSAAPPDMPELPIFNQPQGMPL